MAIVKIFNPRHKKGQSTCKTQTTNRDISLKCSAMRRLWTSVLTTCYLVVRDEWFECQYLNNPAALICCSLFDFMKHYNHTQWHFPEYVTYLHKSGKTLYGTIRYGRNASHMQVQVLEECIEPQYCLVNT